MDMDEEGNIVPDVSSLVYPHVLVGRRMLADVHRLPNVVGKVYRETYDAIATKNFTLAGMGLRATVEAICNDQQIVGKDLAARITKFRTSGILGKKDVGRLHGIRFLGNDAAHDIKTAKPEAVLLALDIIEHALRSLYVFDDEARLVLEMPFESFDDMKRILLVRLKEMSAGTYSLTKWLGDHARRICDQRDDLERATVASVQAGEFHGMTVGPSTPVGGGKPIQAYIKA